MEIAAENWKHFVNIVDDLSADPGMVGGHLFRGQGQSDWRLITSFVRAVPKGVSPNAALQIEKAALTQFRAVAHFHLPQAVVSGSIDVIGWWTLMQHYRAPTRILDWTQSPFVAAYFAIVEHLDKDAAVWCLNVKDFNKKTDELYGRPSLPLDENMFAKPDAPNQIFLSQRRRVTDRMAAQQGIFMFSKNILGDHQDAIEQACVDEKTLIKIVIPAKDKLFYLAKLRRMNITGQALFPGADGIGKSISEMIELSKFGTTGV